MFNLKKEKSIASHAQSELEKSSKFGLYFYDVILNGKR